VGNIGESASERSTRVFGNIIFTIVIGAVFMMLLKPLNRFNSMVLEDNEK
jgi:hypothetical protein